MSLNDICHAEAEEEEAEAPPEVEEEDLVIVLITIEDMEGDIIAMDIGIVILFVDVVFVLCLWGYLP